MTVNQTNVADSPPANTSIAASSRPSFLAKGEIVNVLVGQDKTRYKLHKVLLTAKSPYFATSLKDCWNGKTNDIDLTDEDTSAFDVFVDWLYEGSIGVPRSIGVGEDLFATHTILTLKVFRLAEKFMINEMKNSLLDAVKDCFAKRRHSANILALSDLHSHEGSDTQLYRMFLRDCVARYMKSPACFEGDKNGMGELMEDPKVAKDMLENIREYNKAPWGFMYEAEGCEYHDHTDGSKCD
ncbi:hypothetical protein LTR70_002176 [Exophiala xenobiotica]|uniref:BTB domain-containing protein n=1 Tax=Lithohypha guttulata TaxID=1690604 RepID=A0ABR0K574_9EURO|nr:hypothetical protein LTR24_006776 [Lithohypha guttulata]KAK5326176.1 hypothetical protein LTR70_002176 [Exophiala xenobiotica]